jgi:transposase
MKFVTPLNEATREELRSIVSSQAAFHKRRRSHAILLSDQRFKVDVIASIFEVTRDTVSHWIDRWEEAAFDGLEDKPLPGRPRKTTAKEDAMLCKIVALHPQQSKRARLVLEKKLKKSLSPKTIRRRLKEANYSYRRIERRLADTPLETAYERSKARLKHFEAEHRKGTLHLAYADASGFSLSGPSTRAWQHRDRPLKMLVSSHRKRLNVFGFFTIDQQFDSFIFEQTINDDCIIAAVERYIARLRRSGMNKPIRLVWDNASSHHSAQMDEARERWKKQGVEIEFLPPYSPTLNRIEILWQRVKHLWLPLKAYHSFNALRRELSLVLNGIGSKYLVDFDH